MPKNVHSDSKSSADKKSLNTGSGGAAPGAPGGAPSKKTDRNQMQETRETGQFTGRGRPPLQKK
jgi:hypothetical protein